MYASFAYEMNDAPFVILASSLFVKKIGGEQGVLTASYTYVDTIIKCFRIIIFMLRTKDSAMLLWFRACVWDGLYWWEKNALFPINSETLFLTLDLFFEKKSEAHIPRGHIQGRETWSWFADNLDPCFFLELVCLPLALSDSICVCIQSNEYLESSFSKMDFFAEPLITFTSDFNLSIWFWFRDAASDLIP